MSSSPPWNSSNGTGSASACARSVAGPVDVVAQRDERAQRTRQRAGNAFALHPEVGDRGKLHGRCFEYDGADPTGKRGAFEEAQRDRAAHAEAEDDDVAGAIVEGVRHGGLEVPPLLRPEVVAAVGARDQLAVVAIADDERRDAKAGDGGQRAQRLAAPGAAPVDEDDRRVALAGNVPGGGGAYRSRDRDLLVGDAVRAQRIVLVGEAVEACAGGDGRTVRAEQPSCNRPAVGFDDRADLRVAAGPFEPEDAGTGEIRVVAAQGDAVALDAQHL